ncbi:hypothetical protein V6N13_005557 [Hibiscus sabdariffa]
MESVRRRKTAASVRRRQIITLYVNNIAEKLHRKGLWFAFGRHGEVLDAFIADKRNKEGRKFGFIRTSNNSDANRMIERLNNFYLFGSKITVSVARHQSRKSYWRRVHSGTGNDTHRKDNIGNEGVKGSTRRPDVDLKENVEEKLKQDEARRYEKKELKELSRSRIYGHVETEALWKLKNCLIGEMTTVCSIESIRNRLHNGGWVT